jgi:hypothetical protein
MRLAFHFHSIVSEIRKPAWALVFLKLNIKNKLHLYRQKPGYLGICQGWIRTASASNCRFFAHPPQMRGVLGRQRIFSLSNVRTTRSALVNTLPETILLHAQSLPEAGVLSPKEFLHPGSRAAIDQALSRPRQTKLLRHD